MLQENPDKKSKLQLDAAKLQARQDRLRALGAPIDAVLPGRQLSSPMESLYYEKSIPLTFLDEIEKEQKLVAKDPNNLSQNEGAKRTPREILDKLIPDLKKREQRAKKNNPSVSKWLDTPINFVVADDGGGTAGMSTRGGEGILYKGERYYMPKGYIVLFRKDLEKDKRLLLSDVVGHELRHLENVDISSPTREFAIQIKKDFSFQAFKEKRANADTAYPVVAKILKASTPWDISFERPYGSSAQNEGELYAYVQQSIDQISKLYNQQIDLGALPDPSEGIKPLFKKVLDDAEAGKLDLSIPSIRSLLRIIGGIYFNFDMLPKKELNKSLKSLVTIKKNKEGASYIQLT